MRVAFLLNGMTGYLDAEFRALHELGNDLLVVAPASGPAAGDAMVETAFGDLGTESYAKVLSWHTPPTPGDLVSLVADFEPDAVIMTSWAYTAAYRAVMKSVPSTVVRIIIMDNLWLAAPRQWIGRLLHRFYVDPVADAALVPSDRTEFFARRLGFSAADVIRGSLTCDVALFGSGPRSGEELAEHRAFAFVGRLVHHKGADVLAAAYRRYRDLVDDPWDLHVAGMGAMDDLLRGIPGVTMHGFVQPRDAAALMHRSSCQLVPSHVEPYGVVVHEAAAAGLPILCTDLAGAAPGLVQDGYNGWVVPSGDVDAWAQAMARMSALPAQRLEEMSEVSRSVAARLSPQGWARNLHEEIGRRRANGGQRFGAPRPKTHKPGALRRRLAGRQPGGGS